MLLSENKYLLLHDLSFLLDPELFRGAQADGLGFPAPEVKLFQLFHNQCLLSADIGEDLGHPDHGRHHHHPHSQRCVP